MTRQIGTHGLSCIGDDDYAAWALSMQCNAQAADAALVVQAAALDGYLGRPWIDVVNNNAVVVDDDAGSGSLGPFNTVGQLMRPITSTTVTVTANGIPPSFSSLDVSTLMPPGVYLIGATVNWTLAAATAESYRQLMVYGVRFANASSSSLQNFTDLYRDRDYQGNGGNSGALNAVGFLDNTAGDMAFIEAFFSHANVAGDLTIAAGNWRLWATRLGSGLSI